MRRATTSGRELGRRPDPHPPRAADGQRRGRAGAAHHHRTLRGKRWSGARSVSGLHAEEPLAATAVDVRASDASDERRTRTSSDTRGALASGAHLVEPSVAVKV